MSRLDEADALLMIDMQNSFLHPEGAMRRARGRTLVDVDGTVERNVEAVQLAHARGLPVVYTRHAYRPGYVDAGARTRRLFDAMGDVSPLVAGTWDVDVVDELKPDASSAVVDKTRMDAFHMTDLEVVLRGLGAARLVVAGIVTNACVETTTRSAAMRDFEVTVLADCCTTYSEGHQRSALEALEYYMFAEVMTLAEASA